MSATDSYKKVVLVTGANGGIGFELVRLLAEKGHKVYLGSRTPKAGKEAEERLQNEFGLKATFVQLDLTDSATIKAARDLIEKAEGRLDVLVNNAGHDPKEYVQVFNTNFFGLVECTNTFIPLIRKAKPGYGAVVNVTSGLGSNSLQASPDVPREFLDANPYSASKAAVNSYTIGLAQEFKDEKIRVNCVCPGLVSTKINGYAEGGKTPRAGAQLLEPWVLLGPEDDDKTCKFFVYVTSSKNANLISAFRQILQQWVSDELVMDIRRCRSAG
ncbi:hypothetical protein VNI00_013670 [Paramarasmius palmivorus]|uniref:Uncharacterized protein n=1 Tax=Paramarasmius palmivorus TaxID=297713 RepID=A0AAW0BW70_9AGAR